MIGHSHPVQFSELVNSHSSSFTFIELVHSLSLTVCFTLFTELVRKFVDLTRSVTEQFR